MTTEERVLTALKCEQPDRVPVFVYLNPYEGMRHPSHHSYIEVLKATEEYADIIYELSSRPFFWTDAKIERESRQLPEGQVECVYHTPAGPLTTITRSDWRGGGMVKRWIVEPEDAERMLSIPYEPYRPDLTGFFQARERLRGKCVAQVTLNDPICIAAYIDESAMALWTLEHRDLIKRMLDAAFNRLTDNLEYLLENDVGPIYHFDGPEYALPPLMSPNDFEEFVVEYDSRLFELVHSYPDKYVIVHSHGKVSRFLERFAAMKMDGLNVLEPPPLGDTILADAKQRIGDRVCLIGNIQYDDIVRGTEAKIERLVAEAIEDGASGGGFILSPCASPYEASLSAQASNNLIHYMKMARKYGKYKEI